MQMSTMTMPVQGAQAGAGAAVLAVKAAVSALVQRRNGAPEPARLLYYRAHSLLRALRSHLSPGVGAR
jgi:hypothetical protein